MIIQNQSGITIREQNDTHISVHAYEPKPVSVQLSIGFKEVHLTWMDARHLGELLIDAANRVREAHK